MSYKGAIKVKEKRELKNYIIKENIDLDKIIDDYTSYLRTIIENMVGNNLIEEDKEEIKYNQFSKMPPCNFKFKDITKIIQNDDNIFIFRRDEKLPNFTLIIPNYVFENEEAKIEFINMLSKGKGDKKKQK